MHRSGFSLLRAVVTVSLAGLLLAGCDSAAPTPGSADAAGATSATPSIDPTAGASGGPEGGDSSVVQASRPTAPIAAVRADTLARAWSARWHVKLEVVQNDLVRVRRTTVDYPAGHGKLELSVQQEGTGTDPGPSMVVCVLRDGSLGKKLVDLTRTLLDRMVADCWGPVLAKAERARVADWVMAAKGKVNASGGVNEEHAFPDFAVRLQMVPTSAGLTMYAK